MLEITPGRQVTVPDLDTAVTYEAILPAGELNGPSNYQIAVGPTGEIAVRIDRHGLQKHTAEPAVIGSRAVFDRHFPQHLRGTERPSGPEVSPMGTTDETCRSFPHSVLGHRWTGPYDYYFSLWRGPWASVGDIQPYIDANEQMGLAGYAGKTPCTPNSSEWFPIFPLWTPDMKALTSVRPNQTAAGVYDCGSRDDMSVHGLFVLADSTILANACTWSALGIALEADIAYDMERHWYTGSGTCTTWSPGTPTYDFRSVALHEWGHTMGLGHVDDGRGQVMEEYMSHCETLRGWGLGDMNGLHSIYWPYWP